MGNPCLNKWVIQSFIKLINSEKTAIMNGSLNHRFIYKHGFINETPLLIRDAQEGFIFIGKMTDNVSKM